MWLAQITGVLTSAGKALSLFCTVRLLVVKKEMNGSTYCSSNSRGKNSQTTFFLEMVLLVMNVCNLHITSML